MVCLKLLKSVKGKIREMTIFFLDLLKIFLYLILLVFSSNAYSYYVDVQDGKLFQVIQFYKDKDEAVHACVEFASYLKYTNPSQKCTTTSHDGKMFIHAGWLWDQNRAIDGSYLLIFYYGVECDGLLDENYGCLQLECPEPSIYNKSNKLCEERCPIGSDPETCALPPPQPNCSTVTAHPISLIDGQKWLREPVYQSSYPDGLIITYHYNNHANTRFTAYGYRPQFTAGTYVVRSYEPMYKPFSGHVYPKKAYSSVTETQTQAIATHWKHNYDYTLVKTDSGFTLFTPNGSYTQFNAAGRSVQYPSQKLSEIDNGYALTKGTQSFTFNSDGQLIELKEPNRVIEVTYDDQQQTLTLIKNGHHIETVTIEYDTEHRATRFTFGTGHVELAWDSSLTSLTYFDSSGNQYKKRSFNYEDERFPESVTSIDDDYGSGPEQYAYFEYNDEGKAVMSSLAGDVDRLEVEYPSNYQRIVTNSQGYQKKYYLTENDQFRKLVA
jgi:hypothetical protein